MLARYAAFPNVMFCLSNEWEYGDIKRLIDFFTAEGMRFWKMQPDHEQSSADKRVYVLSEPGRRYVVYLADGGRTSMRLKSGRYGAVRFNPRTAEQIDLGSVSGDVVLETPQGQDWVIRLEKAE